MAPDRTLGPDEKIEIPAAGDVFVELRATVSLNLGYNSTPLEVMTKLADLMSTVATLDSVRDKVLTYHIERILHRPRP